MKIKIISEFTGYPDGSDKSQTLYKAGQIADVPDTFGKLVIGKGLATAETAAPPVSKG